LRETAVDDSKLANLHRIPHLEEVRLAATMVTPIGVEKLRQDAPYLKVVE
jgi:hypothetical protein